MNTDLILESQGITKVIQNFAYATGLAVVLVNLEGKEVSDSINFSKFCRKIRNNHVLNEKCRASDRCGGLEATKANRPCIYKCHAGLTDFSIPIEIGGTLVGFALCGQVKLDDPVNLDDVQEIDKSWMKDPELLEYYDQVPQIDCKRLLASADLLETLIDDSVKGKLDVMVINDKSDIKSLFASDHPIKSNHTRIHKAIRYIERHYFEDLRLEDVAEYVYLSPHYFSKLFKKEVGVGFNHYLNSQRLIGAEKMLQYSDWSVSRIASNLGYSCSSYFCKVFKNAYGMTPQEFRDENFLTHKEDLLQNAMI
ncbi:PocR ligand-binding domain-containing protein [Vibrio hippocampi]|uniref:HTH-type transcriptional activator RhaS n=1 Tax=Vibrio hippocampi TaxID=654686 RepID=A0ABM8ZKZ1_9VIBR|nr:PocR ligand-binding domain-containing protein [Vibrio hippocampi]CAH0528783.1 HTH-type transcriptional activator RhaS [Vibrio hippocampi]